MSTRQPLIINLSMSWECIAVNLSSKFVIVVLNKCDKSVTI